MKVVAVSISEKKGTKKHTVPFVNLIEDFGIEGDAHAGKWHRQVSLLAQESMENMKKKLPTYIVQFLKLFQLVIYIKLYLQLRYFLQNLQLLMLEAFFFIFSMLSCAKRLTCLCHLPA